MNNYIDYNCCGSSSSSSSSHAALTAHMNHKTSHISSNAFLEKLGVKKNIDKIFKKDYIYSEKERANQALLCKLYRSTDEAAEEAADNRVRNTTNPQKGIYKNSHSPSPENIPLTKKILDKKLNGKDKLILFTLVTSDDDMDGSEGFSVYDYENQLPDDVEHGRSTIGTC